MKHPTPEEWMSFLYEEDEKSKHAELEAHARNCPECAGRLRIWAGGRRLLDESPAGTGLRVRPRQPALSKLAVAAVLMLGIGISIGRVLPDRSGDSSRLKAEILKELDQRLETVIASAGSDMQRALAEVTKLQDQRLSNDREALMVALRRLEAGYSAQLAGLRSELETVALNTEDGLLETHQKLGLLASTAASAPVTSK